MHGLQCVKKNKRQGLIYILVGDNGLFTSKFYISWMVDRGLFPLDNSCGFSCTDREVRNVLNECVICYHITVPVIMISQTWCIFYRIIRTLTMYIDNSYIYTGDFVCLLFIYFVLFVCLLGPFLFVFVCFGFALLLS